MANRPGATLPFTVFESPIHATYAWESGPQAVLLVHGFPGTPAEMRRVGDIFAGAGWSGQSLLLPGFGADFPALAHKRHTDWHAAVDSALKTLQQRYHRVVIAGNSMGGALALRAAATHRVDGVVLFAPFWRVDSWLDRLYPVAERVLPRVRPFVGANFADPRLRNELQHFLPDADLADPGVQRAVRRLEFPTRALGQVRRAGQIAYEVSEKVTAPVLIFQGRGDVLVRPAITRQLAGRLPNLAGYVEVDGEHDLVRGVAPGWPTVASLLHHFAVQIAASTRSLPSHPS